MRQHIRAFHPFENGVNDPDILDDGTFVLSFFIFMECLILLIMAGLFYFYSRRG